MDFKGANNLPSLVRRKNISDQNFMEEAVTRIIEICLHLALQNLPLRGHAENENSLNRGNFLELLSFMAKRDQVLEKLINKDKGTIKCVNFQTKLLILI